MRYPMPESGPVPRVSPLWSGTPATNPPPGRHAAGPAPATPPATHPAAEPEIRCAHCDVPIRQWWVHVGPGGAFQCRDRYGSLHDRQYATPAYAPEWPSGGDVA